MAKKKAKKVRLAFRKNRQKRARRKDLTRDALVDEQVAENLASGERLSGKGELTRHRTIVGVESSDTDDEQIVRSVNPDNCLAGRVLRSVGLHKMVRADNGQLYECSVRRVLQTLASDERTAVVAGDRVLITPSGRADQAVIESVEPRTSTLSRGSYRREHVLVSNIDCALIIVSALEPPLKPGLIDRFLISAAKGNSRPIICINKSDLVAPAELQPVVGLYGRLGYDIVDTSTVTGRGIARLKSLMQGRASVVTGQSGVGKSSLLNAINPSLVRQTTHVSPYTGKGRHTTRSAELLELSFGGWVVDTPGIRQLYLWDVDPGEVEAYFIEFRPFVTRCRFPSCTHTHETGCGVKEAVAWRLISQLRYDSYCRILTDDEERPMLYRKAGWVPPPLDPEPMDE